jgi:hypothetical protein
MLYVVKMIEEAYVCPSVADSPSDNEKSRVGMGDCIHFRLKYGIEVKNGPICHILAIANRRK